MCVHTTELNVVVILYKYKVSTNFDVRVGKTEAFIYDRRHSNIHL